MSVDWGAVLADLERERSELDAVIVTVRRRVALHPLAPTGGTWNGKPPKPTYGKVSPEQWAEVRVMWDRGEATKVIAAKLGITETSVYDHAKAYKWPKRPRTAGAVPRGEPLGARVHCPHCALVTEVDPCSNCGKKVRR